MLLLKSTTDLISDLIHLFFDQDFFRDALTAQHPWEKVKSGKLHNCILQSNVVKQTGNNKSYWL